MIVQASLTRDTLLAHPTGPLNQKWEAYPTSKRQYRNVPQSLKSHDTLINQERSLWWKGWFAAWVPFISSVGGENSPKGQSQRQAELLDEWAGGHFLNGKDTDISGCAR